MNVRLIAEIAVPAIVIGSVGVVGWHWRSGVKRFFLVVADWSIRTSEFWDVLETFCNEVAVLWLVFPLLDGLYDRAKDKPAPTVLSILGSFAIAFWFFIAAVYCKKKEQKLEEREKREKAEKESLEKGA